MNDIQPPATPSTSAPRLEYARRPRNVRRRFARAAVVLAFVGAVVCSCVWGPGAYRQARMLYWQRECLRYSLPADRSVYEREPLGTAGRISPGGEYATIRPPSIRAGLAIATTTVGFTPRCVTGFESVLPPAYGGPSAGVLFVHERQTPAGERYLVIVSSNFDDRSEPAFIPGYDLDLRLIRPGTWRQPPANRTGGMPIDVISGIGNPPVPLRIFAGQADPTDPSHFTIRYEAAGVSHAADGYLRGQGNGYAFLDFHCR